MDVGKAMKIFLIKSNKGTRELAMELGVTPSYVSAMLNGKKNITLNFMIQFCRAANCKVSDLVLEAENLTKPNT